MLTNKPSTHKRTLSLLAIVIVFFFSMAATAQTPDMVQFNTQNITAQLDTLNQQISKKNNTYEELTQVLHNINILHHQITSCIKTGQMRLDKINHLVNATELSNTIIHDIPAYDYLINEKKNKLSQVETCNFLNYRLEEIQEVAIEKTNRVSKFKIFKKTPLWNTSSFNLFSTVNLHPDSIYQRSGIEPLNKMYWLWLTLTGFSGLIFAFILQKTGPLLSSPVTRLSKHYILYILPLGLVCICLHIIYPYTTPAPIPILMINAVTLYVVTRFFVKLYFAIGMKQASSHSLLHFFQFFLAFITNAYVVILQILFLKNDSLPLSLVSFVGAIYILLIIKLVIACITGLIPWMTKEVVAVLQKRLFIITTLSLVAYTIYLVTNLLSLSPSFFALLNTLYIILLNLAYYWLIITCLNHWLAPNSFTAAVFALKIICFFAILAACCGYHYIAIMLIPNLVITAGIITLIMDVNLFFKRTYFMLSDPSQIWSQKLRYFLGLNAEDKLIELYIMRLIFTIPAVIWGVFSIIEVWGVTRYQILNLLLKIHDGFTIFETVIRPTLILRAGTFFCIIVLSGRALATYIVRKKLVNEEKHTQIMLFALIQYMSFTVAILTALYIAGFDLKNLVVVAGALSVGLGFGLQSFAKDFISGLVIMINKPIKIGDHIEVGDRNRNEGFIKRIGALSTQLHTLSHSDVIIPNSEIITKVITNFTFSNNVLSRIKITVKLDKNLDFDLAKQMLLDIATKNPNVLQDPPYQPVVLFELYDLNLWCVINDVNKKELILSDLNLKIAYAFKDLFPVGDEEINNHGIIPE